MTRLRAALAVIVFVLFALRRAGVADIRADPADFFGELRASAHEHDRHRAGERAIVIQADTVRHVRDVRLAKAGVCTVFAFLGTLMTGVDTGFVQLMTHGFLHLE